MHLSSSVDFRCPLQNTFWTLNKNIMRNIIRWLSVKRNHVIKDKSRTQQLNWIILLGNIQTGHWLVETSSEGDFFFKKLCFLMDIQDMNFGNSGNATQLWDDLCKLHQENNIRQITKVPSLCFSIEAKWYLNFEV